MIHACKGINQWDDKFHIAYMYSEYIIIWYCLDFASTKYKAIIVPRKASVLTFYKRILSLYEFINIVTIYFM